MPRNHKPGTESRIIFTADRKSSWRAPVNPLMASLSDGAVLEVLTSRSGTWSMQLTNPKAAVCVIAAGDHWQAVASCQGRIPV